MDTQHPEDIPLIPREPGCWIPLTLVQKRFWDFLTKHAEMSERFAGTSVRAFGPLDMSVLRESIEAVVQRHESLRTRIVAVNGRPEQQVDAPCRWHLEIIDLSCDSPITREREELRLTQEFLHEKVDVSVGPMFSAKVLRLSDQEHVVMMGTDHIISDAASAGIVRNEVWSAYGSAVQGKLPSLAPVAVQYADYAVWQHKSYDAWRVKHESYWNERLADAPLVEFPDEKPTSPVTQLICVLVEISLGTTLTNKLREVAWKQRTPLSLAVLALFVAMLSRWCNQCDFVVQFATHGRQNHDSLTNTTGFLASSLHLRIKIPQGDCFIDLLETVNLEFRSASQHYDYDRVPDLIPQCRCSLGFNWTLTSWSRRKASEIPQPNGVLAVNPFPIRRSEFRLVEPSPARTLSVWVFPDDSNTNEGIVATLGYENDKFSSDTINHAARSVRSFWEVLLQCPRSPITSLALFYD